MKATNVLSVHDVSNVYRVPDLLQNQNLHSILKDALNLDGKMTLPPNLIKWNEMANSVDLCDKKVVIALIGKYTGLQDSYLSVIKALRHASVACQVKFEINWVEASKLMKENGDDSENGGDYDEDEYKEAWDKIITSDGVVVPGGFGQRGWEGKIMAAKYCREHNKPYLGVCLGFQAMVVEYARNCVSETNDSIMSQANSTEIDETTPYPTIIFMPEIDKETMGGTMRLGSRSTKFTHTVGDDKNDPGITRLLYGFDMIYERHRHRYEVNPDVVDTIHNAGLAFVGRDGETGTRMEIAELSRTKHPYYVGCQFHPEFKSRPLKPSPPFHGLVLAASNQLGDYLNEATNK